MQVPCSPTVASSRRHNRLRAPLALLLLCLCSACCTSAVSAREFHAGADPEKNVERDGARPRKWAVLIGIEGYHRAARLRHTINDVRQLADSLHRRADYRPENILAIVDSEPNPRFQPLRASLLAELPKFLARPGPQDLVLVYFSGHGLRDREGKLYLAPIDCDPKNPRPTAVSVEWFREQLAGCKAKTKLLVLDACHAGSEKGGGGKNVAAKDLGTPFRDLAGVVTLASSTSDELSQIWEEKQQSLFSYWLNQALKGHADRDGDGSVTIDELYAYVHRNVTHSAKTLFPRAQTPVRIVRSGTPGVPEIARLKPQSVKGVLADMAEQLSWAMHERQLTTVGVLEFTNDTRLGELLGADFGLLGRYCAEELERQLMYQGTDKFSVIDRRRLQKALKDQGFAMDDLASTSALGQLSRRLGGMPVIALGTLRSRLGRVVALRCKLVQVEQTELAGVAGGSAVLNESEWGMLGRSVRVRPEDRRPDAPFEGQPIRPAGEVLIERLDRRSLGPHPLLDPGFPFRLKIYVKTPGSPRPVERKGVFRGNDLFVPLEEGEIYEIWIENLSGELVLMRLLVDGLNTLPEKVKAKGVYVEELPGQTEEVPAQRVNLAEARHWILDPGKSRLVAVRGFFSTTTAGSKYREFVVVDEQASLAARQQFTDQIGLITAAFYAPKGGSRAVGTGAGTERIAGVEARKGPKCGNLLGVVHVRYVSPQALTAAERKRGQDWGVQFAGVNANRSDPVFVPGFGRKKACLRWDWTVVPRLVCSHVFNADT